MDKKESKRVLIVVVLLSGFVTIFLLALSPNVRSNISLLFSKRVNLEAVTDPNIKEEDRQLVEGFPEFPVYGDAVLVKSATLVKPGSELKGYRAEWESDEGGDVPEIIAWYSEELKGMGWEVWDSADAKAYGEQIIKAVKDDITAFLRVELHEGNKIEIEVDMPVDKD